MDALTEGNISGHAEGDCLGQRCGLSEEVQVVEGEDQLNRLIHLNGNLETEISKKGMKMFFLTSKPASSILNSLF